MAYHHHGSREGSGEHHVTDLALSHDHHVICFVDLHMQTLRHVKDLILKRINMHPAAIEGEQLATTMHITSHDIT